MNFIENAVWQVESSLAMPVTLEEIASRCGVSPAHLTRAFASSTGLSLMRYARARRLSVAARILALGIPDILNLALDVGYRSHEAFTRAFRDHFGVTPEQVRDSRSLANLALTEPLAMPTNLEVTLAAPTFSTQPAMRLAGLIKTFPVEEMGAIPSLWEKFNQMQGAIEDTIGNAAYGVSLAFSEEEGCRYMAAVEVTRNADLPPDVSIETIPTARYARFAQPGHISTMRSTIHAIWGEWLPKSGYRPGDGPIIEYYGPEFDPVTGNGGFEIWCPIAA